MPAKKDKARSEAEVDAELAAAKAAVSALQIELDDLRDEQSRTKANDAIIEAYEKEQPALQAKADELELFRTAEITFLETMLPKAVRTEVAALRGKLETEVAGLAGKVDTASSALDAAKAKLEAAKAAREAAAAELAQTLKLADPIRARLRAAEAIKTEVNKAEEEGDYARAFWLAMPDGALQRQLKAEPELIAPDKLRDALEAARTAAAEAADKVTAAEAPIADLEKKLAEAKTAHEAAGSTLEQRVATDISKLNPKPAVPA